MEKTDYMILQENLKGKIYPEKFNENAANISGAKKTTITAFFHRDKDRDV
jgi:hypothetical protein